MYIIYFVNIWLHIFKIVCLGHYSVQDIGVNYCYTHFYTIFSFSLSCETVSTLLWFLILAEEESPAGGSIVFTEKRQYCL